MGFPAVPPHEWDSAQVEQWVVHLGFASVAPIFRSNGVVGKDLTILTTEDLTGAMGCTAWQAKKIQAELAQMGVQAAQGVPVSPTAREAYPPPPAGYPPPPAGYAPPAPYYPPSHEYMGMVAPPRQQQQQALGGRLSNSDSMSLANSKELDDLKAELAREKLKNDLRQEVDVSARLAAMEAGARGAAGATVVSNNNNNSNAAASAASADMAAAAASLAHAARVSQRPQIIVPQTPQIIGYENYCGGCSWCIGLFLFPCIACCPVDTRPIYGIPARGVAVRR